MTHIVLKGLPGLTREELFQLINEFVDAKDIVTAHGGFDLDWRTAMKIIKRFADILDGPENTEDTEVVKVQPPTDPGDGGTTPRISYEQATRKAAARGARKGA